MPADIIVRCGGVAQQDVREHVIAIKVIIRRVGIVVGHFETLCSSVGILFPVRR
jgi:hypothetical protein